jgi:hypothetical protein
MRRILEKHPSYNTGSVEEHAIMGSATLFSNLDTVVALYRRGAASDEEINDAINEAACQYGATGDVQYIDKLTSASGTLGAPHSGNCIAQLVRLR